MKNNINQQIKEIELINTEINSLIESVDNKEYDKAKELIVKLNSMNLSEEQLTSVSEMNNKIEGELAEIEAKRLENEQEKLIAEEEDKKQQSNTNSPIELSEVIDYVSQFIREDERVVSVLGSGQVTSGYEIASTFNVPSTEKNDSFYTILTDFGQKIEDGFVVNIRNRNVYNSYGERCN